MRADGATIFGFTIGLQVTPFMSPGFDVIVFHVLENGEMVAGRAHVKVQQCYDNQVWQYTPLRSSSSFSN